MTHVIFILNEFVHDPIKKKKKKKAFHKIFFLILFYFCELQFAAGKEQHLGLLWVLVP